MFATLRHAAPAAISGLQRLLGGRPSRSTSAPQVGQARNRFLHNRFRCSLHLLPVLQRAGAW